MEVHKSAQDVYKKRVPVPNPDAINTGLSYLKPETLIKRFGHARLKKDYADDYQETDNPTLQALLVRREITGLGRVYGLIPAIESLTRIMNRVRLENPNLLSVLSSGGMFNCRRIRGTKDRPSNHAYGLAIDIKVDGQYDVPNDGQCFVALLELYKYFYAEGWYWGSEFGREDSMHFEVAEETLPRMFGDFKAAVADEAKDKKVVKKIETIAKEDAKAISDSVKAELKAIDEMGVAQLRSYLATEGVAFTTRMTKDQLLKTAKATAKAKGK